MDGVRSRRPHSTFQNAWEEAKAQGEMDWLEDQTLIAADCFEPPKMQSRLRAWDRVAVPTTIFCRSECKVQKRVNLKAQPDSNYAKATAELDCQSLDPRKHARTSRYIRPCGKALFEDDCTLGLSGAEELAKAREHVKTALKAIWEDNVRLRDDLPPYNKLRDRKPSTFDPATLARVTPAKRHNSRWPIPPPRATAAMIAPFQPLIKFELHPNEIDDPGFLEQLAKEAQTPPLRLPKTSAGTKVADSRLKEFTIFEVSEDSNNVADTSSLQEDDSAVQTEEAKTDAPRLELSDDTADSGILTTSSMTDKAAVFSASLIPSSTPSAWPKHHMSAPSVAQTERTPISAVAIFDQPSQVMQEEPEYESKRRVSLDNARRSDRSSDARIIQRVWNYLSGKSGTIASAKRRHSDITHNATPSVPDPKRRRTFDVDVSKTLDIFGQPVQRVSPQIPAPLDTTWRENHDKRFGFHRKDRRLSTGPTRSMALTDDTLPVIQEEMASMFQRDSGAEETAGLPIKTTLQDKADTSLSLQDSTNQVRPASVQRRDSELEFLHKFVQRAKTSKGRRDVQSTTMTRPCIDSPNMSGDESVQPASTRVPLGTKDSNKSPSPSPGTKRKLQRFEQLVSPVPTKKTRSRLAIPDFEDKEPPARARRRRRGAESDTDDILNPEMGIGQDLTQRRLGSKAEPGVIRRSSRIAENKVGEALRGSTIPISIRMPGSFVLDDVDMPAVSTVGVNAKKNEKERDQETKKNTKRNSNGALPVAETLARLQQEEEAIFGQENEPIETVPAQRGGKCVQWARTLRHIQFSDGRIGTEPDTESADDEEDLEEDGSTKPVSVDGEDIRLPTPPKLRPVAFAVSDPSVPPPDTIMVREYGDTDNDKTDNVIEFEGDQPAAIADNSNNTVSATQRKTLGTPRATKMARPGQSRRSLRSGTGISRLPTLASSIGGGLLASSGGSLTTTTTSIPNPLQFSSNRLQGSTPAKLAPLGRLTRGGGPMLGMAGPGTPRPRRRGGFPR
ncbi:hypothetical protein BD289DRAFT_487225 [Coniella lustricola]|uniref:Uncharacterized protein n=1 Tax=Coniella lustricola TaxID=2025994 RepID=A0A2T2ZSH2_9PEZI|nr:hypothetical protein BD289DRAFT_487225 [Coniella lustricola]